MWDIIAGLASAVAAIAGLLFGIKAVRETSLRKNEAYAWSRDVIYTLQHLLILCISDLSKNKLFVSNERIPEIVLSTSVLVEQGRLLFKNEIVGNYGAEKHPAYRGYRPKILDPLVTAHQIARSWASANIDARIRMRLTIEDELKKFVSLAQYEVGRSHSASAEANKGGDGIQLSRILDSVDKQKVADFKIRLETEGIS